MAKCELTIELEDAKTVYHPGDQVRGWVSATTDGPVRCDALTVELDWSTHGRGNTTAGVGESVQVFAGELQGPTTSRFPFAFELPAGPATYHGHYLNVGWFLRARADVPWKIDPKAELEIVLAAGPEEHQQIDPARQYQDGVMAPQELQVRLEREIETARQAGGVPTWIKLEASSSGGRPRPRIDWAAMKQHPVGLAIGCGCLGFGLLFVGGFLAGFGTAAWHGIGAALEGRWDEAIPGLVFGLILLLGVLAAGAWLVRRRMIAARFGDVRFEVFPTVVRAGDPITVQAFFLPGKAMSLDRSAVSLWGTERVTRGSGTNRSTSTHEIGRVEVDLAPARPVAAGLPVQIDGTIVVPEQAAPSFGASDNHLSWTLSLRLEVARAPDWSDTREIVVVP